MPVDPIATFGRGVIVTDGRPVPEPWTDRRIRDRSMRRRSHRRSPSVERLHDCWSARRPVVVRLAVDPGSFRAPQSITGEPWTHSPHTEPWFDRLHFLVWANNYDCRGDAAPGVVVGAQGQPAAPRQRRRRTGAGEADVATGR